MVAAALHQIKVLIFSYLMQAMVLRYYSQRLFTSQTTSVLKKAPANSSDGQPTVTPALLNICQDRI